MKPWDVVEVFTEERLARLAQEAVWIRNEALQSHKPELGDGQWCLGCRVYERTVRRLEEASKSKALPWLTVDLNGLFVTIKVGGWPLRIYRGSADRPHSNCRRSGLRDLTEQPSLPGLESLDGNWFWVMAVETDTDGKPVRVVVEQSNEAGVTRWPWIVPIDLGALPPKAGAAPASKVAAWLPEAVDPGKPVVGPKSDKSSKEDVG